MKRTYKITSCIKYSDAAAYLGKSCANDDIFIFDFSNFEKGAALAKQFYSKNPLGTWVFIGGDVSSLLRVLPLRPSAYIGKTENPESVNSIISVLHRQCERKQKKTRFTFKYDGDWMQIPYDNINYFESSAKKVILHMAKSDTKYYFTEKLDNISDIMPDFFNRCHQSYLVNMNMIKQLDSKSHAFVMINNDEVWISRRLYTESKNKYEAFMRDKNN
ncbi:MAG: LytTR family transcriptional regulator DNA-binding domain-containing protein [Oscillospiraceae bacterium]|nr:LytTR family transcriptional regulator DNA-binding domain-containing protein [Oscillospiraceae bacterium]